MSAVLLLESAKTKRWDMGVQEVRTNLRRRGLHALHEARHNRQESYEGHADPSSLNEEEKAVIMLTTSRRPTNRIRTFCNELARCVPNCVRVNRGKLSREGVAEKALEIEANRVVIVNRWKGGPGKIELFKVDGELVGLPPLVYVRGIKLQREFDKSRMKPFNSIAVAAAGPSEDLEIGRLAGALSGFFGLPAMPMDEASSGNFDACMLISRDASRKIRLTFVTLPEGREVGPRITISKLAWRLGK